MRAQTPESSPDHKLIFPWTTSAQSLERARKVNCAVSPIVPTSIGTPQALCSWHTVHWSGVQPPTHALARSLGMLAAGRAPTRGAARHRGGAWPPPARAAAPLRRARGRAARQIGRAPAAGAGAGAAQPLPPGWGPRAPGPLQRLRRLFLGDGVDKERLKARRAAWAHCVRRRVLPTRARSAPPARRLQSQPRPPTQALGMGAFASYGFISNINYGFALGGWKLACVVVVLFSSCACASRRGMALTQTAWAVCARGAAHALAPAPAPAPRAPPPPAAARPPPRTGAAWIAFVRRYGVAPTAAGQWPAFLAFYAGFWAVQNFARWGWGVGGGSRGAQGGLGRPLAFYAGFWAGQNFARWGWGVGGGLPGGPRGLGASSRILRRLLGGAGLRAGGGGGAMGWGCGALHCSGQRFARAPGARAPEPLGASAPPLPCAPRRPLRLSLALALAPAFDGAITALGERLRIRKGAAFGVRRGAGCPAACGPPGGGWGWGGGCAPAACLRGWLAQAPARRRGACLRGAALEPARPPARSTPLQ